MKSFYSNYIFDFDGTIADLSIDWDECRAFVNKGCKEHQISNELSLSQKIIDLGKISHDYLDVIYQIETTKGAPKYTLIATTINFIKSLNKEIYIISHNHSKTIADILTKEGLINSCQKIIGINDINFAKPNIEPYQHIQPYIKLGSSLYIGDRETDRQFAESANLDFIFTNEII